MGAATHPKSTACAEEIMNEEFEMEKPVLKSQVQNSTTLCLKTPALCNETWLLHHTDARPHTTQTEQ
jgi:hypothetical protein